MPILINVPAFAIVMLITWLLLRGAQESATANNIMVIIKLHGVDPFRGRRVDAFEGRQLHPFAPNGFKGIHQGAAIVFFAYIGFDAISTAAEETINPQRNLPIGILGGLAICTVIYVIVGFVLTGMVPYKELGSRPIRWRALWNWPALRRWNGLWPWARRCPCRRCFWCFSTANPASFSPWLAMACCPSGLPKSTRARAFLGPPPWRREFSWRYGRPLAMPARRTI